MEQPQPTSNGRVVLFEALHDLAHGSGDFEWLRIALLERAQMGKQKYGTYLRAHNGRDALQDALDEALDGYMYAMQLNMESPSREAEQLGLFFFDAAHLCKMLIDKRQRKPLTRTFNDLRAEFGQGWQDDNAD